MSVYSYDERMRAVQFYIESGCSEIMVFRELGYPSPNALRQWYNEYMQTGTLHSKANRRDVYSQEQIDAAVAYYNEHGGSLIATCRALGYPDRNTMSQWVRAAYPDGGKPPVRRCKSDRELVRYTPEQKQAAVEAWMSGTPDYKIAAQYGVCKATVYNWKKELLGKVSVRMKKQENTASFEALSDNKEELKAEVKSLQAEIHRLKMERDILEKAAEILKKGDGINLESLTNAEKADVIGAMTGEYRLSELLKSIKMAKSSYFYQRKATFRPDKYKNLRASIRSVFRDNFQCYGYRRIHTELCKGGKSISEKVVRRIMREEDLHARCAKRRRYSSYMGEISPAVANIVSRDFHADAPNRKWLTDLTEFALPAGKVYLSPMVDCFDGCIVSWTIGTSPNAELANTMLDEAIAQLSKDEHPIVHSDRGGHYRWPDWVRKVESAGLVRSMSKKGCSPDNAACEGFFGRLKNEMFYGRSWMGVSIDAFIGELDAYVRWYNEKRIKLSLGGMSPLEYRRSLGLIA